MARYSLWKGSASGAILALGIALTASNATAQEAPPAAPGQPDTFQASLANQPSAAQAPAAPFEIRAFAVTGNTVLAADKVERAIYPYTGPGKTPTDVERERAALQKAFEDAG